MRQRIASFYGSFLIFLSICLVLPLLVSIIYKEYQSTMAFCVAILCAMLPAGVINKFSRIKLNDAKFKLRDSFFIVSSSWIIASAIGCIPYIVSGSLPNFVDAFFETASGFTTTGSTVIDNIEAMPKSILFWRSFTQWLGGMGIMVLFVALIPNFGIKARSLAGVEAPGPTITKLSARFSGTAQLLYMAYVVFTIALTILLMLGGVSFYDAITHAFTTMATGGFSTHSESIAYFNSYYITWVITIFMIIAGTNFNLFFVALSGSIKNAVSDEEFKFYIKYIIVTVAMIVACLMYNHTYDNLFDALTHGAFQVVTIMSTTGYATANYCVWPIFCQMLLLGIMITGASSSSTAGGMKIVRVLILGKMIKREIKLRIHDNIVEDVKLNRKKVDIDTLTYIMAFTALYIITTLLGTFLVSLNGSGDLVTNFSAVLTCISNVGPGLNNVGPAETFSFFPSYSKFILSIIMIAGRLELSAFFMMFTVYFWNPHKA